MNEMNANTKLVKLNDGTPIRIVNVPFLNLYIITDINNFGNHWIRVTRQSVNVFTTKTLFGSNDLEFAPIARFLAEKLMKRQTNDNLIEDKHILFNLSLKNKDREVVKEIAQHLSN